MKSTNNELSTFNVLGLDVDVFTYESIVNELINATSQVFVTSVNPEIVLNTKEDEQLKHIINSSEFHIADGIGVVKAVEILYKEEIDRITGIDLLDAIFKSSLKDEKTFLFGSKVNVAKQASKKLSEKYGCNIVGDIDGYQKDNKLIVEKINESEATILLVGLGSPMQEYWVNDYRNQLKNVRIIIVVGGCFDVLSGQVKRAPMFMQKIHLEWLYRLFKQPSRIFRQVKLFKFILMVFREKLK